MADTGGARESPVQPAAPAGADDWVVLDQNDPNLSPPQPSDADRAAVAAAAAAAAAAASSPPAASAPPREAPVQDAVEYDGSVGSWESEEEGAAAEANAEAEAQAKEDAETNGTGESSRGVDGPSAAPSAPVSPPSPTPPSPPQEAEEEEEEEEAVVVEEAEPAPLPPRVVMLRGEPVDLRQPPAPAPATQQQQQQQQEELPPPPPPAPAPRRVKEFRFPSLGGGVAYRAKEVVKCADAACGLHADECGVETPAVYLAAPLRADGTEVPGGQEKVVKVLAPTCAVARAGAAVGAAAAAAASAAGGHIVAAEAVDAAGGGTACLMEHYKLGSLQALAGRLSASQGGGVPEEQILSVALQLLKALKAMPRGHRRICPAHVLCEMRSGGYSVALLPPEVLGEVPVVQDGEQELLYAAPEEVERRRSRGCGDEDGCSSKEARAADIFSVGAALFSITFLSTPAILQGVSLNDRRWEATGCLRDALHAFRSTSGVSYANGEGTQVLYSTELMSILSGLLAYKEQCRVNVEPFIQQLNDHFGSLLTGVIEPEVAPQR